ncbi:glutathione S-transferase [Gloeophyllum trabeum ATCC 11539]|uniref:Glutathione S-transferase n=1 Tax=Gloeophyllum trabeum (strain ATCC 11539 / FP-39264 / Madison 617) TaxID=670483 RepID=S7Q1C3_GLOTA|nr:glutathione S-transferase [Gloeophyllum trabeum ATCC 11539]EPQ53756.1 glutathione S-transferase [Gloeophyllum trabeum ATCC 11539]
MPEKITLYTAKVCPYAHRVELALEEVGAPYEPYQIDLQNKPEWYAPQINPASKVPAVAYGGPPTSPDKPSPESTKIAESLVLLEFVADLYPNSHLLPKDPVLRAKARFFIDAVGTKLNPKFFALVMRGEPGAGEGLLQGIEEIQKLLPEEGKGKYAVGDVYTIADAAITPFLARMEVAIKNDLGAFEPGEGTKVYEKLQGDPKYARFRKYLDDVKARPSFQKTFDEGYLVEAYRKRYEPARAQKKND